MSPIDVEPDQFDAASKVFGQAITAQVTNAASGLSRALAPSAAMAGSDPAGTNWAASYDRAASGTFDAITMANGGCFRIAAALEKSGFNHASAESHSDPTGKAPPPPDTTNYTTPNETLPPPPSAAGGSGSPPHGWGLIEHLVGYVWPNGHQDKLRAAAQSWTAAAGSLDGAAADVPEAVEAINGQQSPEVGDAVDICQQMGQHIRDLADGCRSLSTACSDFAGAIDKAHSDVEHELVSLVEWTVGIEAGGALLGAVSFGIGEGAAQAAEAGRIAATAARVSGILARLTEAAGTVGKTIESMTAKIVEVAQRLKAILRLGTEDAPVTQAAEEEAESLGRLERGCFLPGTMVLTENGHRPIEELAAGDLVVATNPLTGIQELRPVNGTTMHTVFHVIDLVIAGQRVSCTPEHPFWVPDRGWTKAVDLTIGDEVLDARSRPCAVEAVAIRTGAFTVHNVEVDGLHTFHVSCASILVHNKPMRIRPEEPKRRDTNWLKRNGVDPHTVKDILPGPPSRFDIYVDRNGNMWGVRKGANPIDGEFLGNINDFK